MVFNINEAAKNTPDKSKLPRNPKQFIEQKWKKKDLVNFVNPTDTNRLKKIVAKIIKAHEDDGGFKTLNKLNAAINKSEATVVRVYKGSGHDELYYIAPINALWQLMPDSEWPGGYMINEYRMELSRAIECMIENDEG